jgi:hypothetical protein
MRLPHLSLVLFLSCGGFCSDLYASFFIEETLEKYRFSPRYITSDGEQPGNVNQPKPEIRLGCLIEESDETVNGKGTCSRVQFLLKTGTKVLPFGPRNFTWKEFQEPSKDQVTLGIQRERSGALWREELSLGQSIRWNEGERFIPNARPGLQKAFSAVNGAFQWALFHSIDAVTWTITKPHYWNVRAEVKRNIQAFEFITGQNNQKGINPSVNHFETFEEGFEDLKQALTLLSRNIPEEESGEEIDSTPGTGNR